MLFSQPNSKLAYKYENIMGYFTKKSDVRPVSLQNHFDRNGYKSKRFTRDFARFSNNSVPIVEENRVEYHQDFLNCEKIMVRRRKRIA